MSQGRGLEIRAGVDRAYADVNRARADLDRARAALAALDDEARRGGALPGWIR